MHRDDSKSLEWKTQSPTMKNWAKWTSTLTLEASDTTTTRQSTCRNTYFTTCWLHTKQSRSIVISLDFDNCLFVLFFSDHGVTKNLTVSVQKNKSGLQYFFPRVAEKRVNH
jgi:hypothetical protein